jgi:hypothetical protein
MLKVVCQCTSYYFVRSESWLLTYCINFDVLCGWLCGKDLGFPAPAL